MKKNEVAEVLDALGVTLVTARDAVDDSLIAVVDWEQLAKLLDGNVYVETQGMPPRQHRTLIYGPWRDGPHETL